MVSVRIKQCYYYIFLYFSLEVGFVSLNKQNPKPKLLYLGIAYNDIKLKQSNPSIHTMLRPNLVTQNEFNREEWNNWGRWD